MVYPTNITVSQGEHTLKVNELLFPYFTKTRFSDRSGPILLNHRVPTVQVWYLGNGADTRFVKNDPSAYDAFLDQNPFNALANLQLSEGRQTDPIKAFDAF